MAASVQRVQGTSQGAVSCELFFDRQAVIRAVGQAQAKVLGHQGGLVRKIARQSIKRKGYARPEPKTEKAKAKRQQEAQQQPASPPGSPPYTHTGFLREDIIYALDPLSTSVVIGPWSTPWLNRLHEFGGTLSITVRGSRRTARYPARPFMGPALARAIERIPALWEGQVR